jgi:AraC-like DNA-binding protein
MAHYIFGWKSAILQGQGPCHKHDAMELVYHLKGTGVVIADGTELLPFEKGNVQIMPAMCDHAQHQQRRGVDCCILFDAAPTIRDRLANCFSRPDCGNAYPAAELDALSTLPRPQNASEQWIADCRLTAALLELMKLNQLLEPERVTVSRRDEIAESAHDHIRSHWREITHLQQVADALGVSLHYLRHVYRQYYGQTIYQAITQLRIEHACDLLRNSQLPQKAMPEICGFADVQQFSRRFKQITGIAPGAYRKMAMTR